jgi:predicted AlkP superfamily pyrophosphatase or phosphodiesterase
MLRLLLLLLFLPLALAAAPPLIMISYDGFRWDYVNRPGARWFKDFASKGAQARSLIPCFPSKTYPNHYSLATGLYPAHHGLLTNKMLDPTTGEIFTLADRSKVEDGFWWEGEPLWVTAEKQGIHSAIYYWPGSEAKIQGIRPSHWRRYNGTTSFWEQADQVIRWLELPEDQRPGLIMLYFREPDASGHRYGPNSKQVEQQLSRLSRVTASLLLRVRARLGGREPNVLLVSDHGMTPTSPEKILVLDDFFDQKKARMVDAAPVTSIWPKPGEGAGILQALRKVPHLKSYAREEIPPRYHFYGHRRIPPILAVADPGWLVTTLAKGSDYAKLSRGMHGYSPGLQDMHGLFIARGPAFASGVRLGSIKNIQVYNAACRVLGLQPAPNDGDSKIVAPLFGKVQP